MTVGYSAIGFTIQPSKAGQIPPNPLSRGSPFPRVDPKLKATTDGIGIGGRKGPSQEIRQLSRLHIVLNDPNVHGLVSLFLPEISLPSNLDLINCWSTDNVQHGASTILRLALSPTNNSRSIGKSMYRVDQTEPEPSQHHHPFHRRCFCEWRRTWRVWVQRRT